MMHEDLIVRWGQAICSLLFGRISPSRETDRFCLGPAVVFRLICGSSCTRTFFCDFDGDADRDSSEIDKDAGDG